MRGCAQALAEAGLSLEAEVVSDGQTSVGKGKAQTAELLRPCARDRSGGLFERRHGGGGLFHCLDAGIRVPDQLALFGFNGLDIGRALPQPLSTIRSNRFLIGQQAVEVILAEPMRPERS